MAHRGVVTSLLFLLLISVEGGLRSRPLNAPPDAATNVALKAVTKVVKGRKAQPRCLPQQVAQGLIPSARSQPSSCHPSEDPLEDYTPASSLSKVKKAMKNMKRMVKTSCTPDELQLLENMQVSLVQ